jgi:hypothetical protein
VRVGSPSRPPEPTIVELARRERSPGWRSPTGERRGRSPGRCGARRFAGGAGPPSRSPNPSRLPDSHASCTFGGRRRQCYFALQAVVFTEAGEVLALDEQEASASVRQRRLHPPGEAGVSDSGFCFAAAMRASSTVAAPTTAHRPLGISALTTDALGCRERLRYRVRGVPQARSLAVEVPPGQCCSLGGTCPIRAGRGPGRAGRRARLPFRAR